MLGIVLEISSRVNIKTFIIYNWMQTSPYKFVSQGWVRLKVSS